MSALRFALVGALAAACQHKVVAWGEIDRDVVVDLVSEVARIRQVWPTRPVRVKLQRARDLRAAVARELSDDVASGAIARRQRAWGKVGLVPWEFDLAAWERRTYGDDPAGYYLTSERRLYVVDRPAFRSDLLEVWGAVVGRDPAHGEALAHEVAHALVDQRHDLDALLRADLTSDREIARRALAEGDATKVAFAWDGGGRFSRHLDRLEDRIGALSDDGTPEWLRARVSLPYVAGGRIVERLHSAGGWPAVDRAYAAPPESTEQLLHPGRYPSDRPTTVTVPDDPIDPAGRRILRDTLGELGMRSVLRRHVPRARADAAADGWDGDAVGVWETGDGMLLVWLSVWDSARDAEQWADAYEELVEGSYGDPRRIAAPPGAVAWTTREGAAGIERRGERVLVYEGAPEAQRDRIRALVR